MDRLLEATARAERDHFWFRGFRAFIRPLLDEAAAGRGPLQILDCGCGTGNNLTLLLRAYGRAFGVDLTWSGLAYARDSGVAGLARANVTRLPFGDARFDLVTSFDVLQCLVEPDETRAAAEMRRVLRPGGHALIHVSAFDALRGDHSILSHELHRYSRGRLRRIVEGTGFKLVRLTYTNAALVPVLLIVRSLQRRRGLVTSDQDEVAAREISIPPAPVNAVLSAALSLEARLARHVNLPFGSSLLCLAKKLERTP